MSWRDCHIGYLPLAYLLLILGWISDSGFLIGIGFVAQLNGLYALLLYDSDNKRISAPVWVIAMIASVVIYALFCFFQLNTALVAGKLPPGDFLVLMTLTTLSWNQIRFLIRVQRAVPTNTYSD